MNAFQIHREYDTNPSNSHVTYSIKQYCYSHRGLFCSIYPYLIYGLIAAWSPTQTAAHLWHPRAIDWKDSANYHYMRYMSTRLSFHKSASLIWQIEIHIVIFILSQYNYDNHSNININHWIKVISNNNYHAFFVFQMRGVYQKYTQPR